MLLLSSADFSQNKHLNKKSKCYLSVKQFSCQSRSGSKLITKDISRRQKSPLARRVQIVHKGYQQMTKVAISKEGPNCSQRISADDKSRHKQGGSKLFTKDISRRQKSPLARRVQTVHKGYQQMTKVAISKEGPNCSQRLSADDKIRH